MKIAVDVDDVLTYTGEKYIEYHNKRFGTHLRPEEFYDFDCLKRYGFSSKERFRRVLEYVKNETPKMKPVSGANEVLQNLKKKHELIVITGRSNDIMGKTEKWVKVHYPDVFSDFISTNVHHINGGKDKGQIAEELGVDLIIDDYMGYAIECANQGIGVLLMTRPWNVSEEIENNLIVRVDSWEEIAQKIR
ncbi:MAG: hypothetical protein U9O20_01065 [Patescibacteria group bacterium]|nr:hypothetical protein [Patescibacteria group bacterium]